MMGWGAQTCPPPQPPPPTIPLNVSKFSQLCRAIPSLAKDVSLLNLAILLILRRSFQWCRRFPLTCPYKS